MSRVIAIVLLLLVFSTLVALVLAEAMSRADASDPAGAEPSTPGEGLRTARQTLAGALVEVRPATADGIDDLIGHIYDTDPAELRAAARKAMDRTLANRVQLNRRLRRIAGDLPDLAALPRQLQDFYLIEVPK